MVFGCEALVTPSWSSVPPPPPPPTLDPRDGRQWMIDRLSPTDQAGSMEQARASGRTLFDDAYQLMKNDRGVRIEDMVAMLGSVGGHLCLAAVLDGLRQDRLTPPDIGMMTIAGKDGHTYHFGDAPNWLLCEAPYSLLRLLFDAARQHGAAVDVEMIHEDMALAAQRLGGPAFFDLNLAEDHDVFSPIDWSAHFTPVVRRSMTGKIAPPARLPTIVGFALQQAIDVGRDILDPKTLAIIAMKCAIRTATINPVQVESAHAA